METKIAILGDTHFGIRGDLEAFHYSFRMFYETIFFPYLIENNITTVIQVGDLFDKRKSVNFNTLALCREYFFDRFKELGIKLITLVGNHDSFFKNTIKVNAIDLLLEGYENISINSKPSCVDGFDIIPWICSDNKEEIVEYIKNSDAQYCFGHFEFEGFALHAGFNSRHGMECSNIFDKYDKVFSGHYHTQSEKRNIQYVGAPAEYTWSDYGDPRGFWILDTKSGDRQFIKNEFSMFHKIIYDDTNGEVSEPNFNLLKNTFVKIIIVNRKDAYKFDKWIKKLNIEGELYELQIQEFEKEEERVQLTEDDIKDASKSTIEFIKDYINNNTEYNNKTFNMMSDIHEESITIND